MTLRVLDAPVRDFPALGAEWEALGAPGFFQGWTWIGCLAEERFTDPVLLRALDGARTVGLALFNRRQGALWLTEAGHAEHDRPFIEHNAPLLAADAPPGTAEALLRAAWRVRGARRLVLGGVPPGLAAAAGGIAWRQRLRPAPYLDLDALRAAGGDWPASLSANARYQLRRSDRRYAARGPIRLRAAATAAEAQEFLAELMPLHDQRRAALGEVGAFATPWLRRFHTALVARGWPRGEVEMLRVTAGEALVGLLYHFRAAGQVHAYQSGWVDPGDDPHAKPGWTCHHAAIALSLGRGDHVYDFMAGDQRYKRSLSGAELNLAWAERVPRASARGVLAWARGRWADAKKAARGPAASPKPRR